MRLSDVLLFKKYSSGKADKLKERVPSTPLAPGSVITNSSKEDELFAVASVKLKSLEVKAKLLLFFVYKKNGPLRPSFKGNTATAKNI